MTGLEHRAVQPLGVAGVLDQMQERLDALPASMAKRRVFLSTYQRTTAAVGEAIEQAFFEDPAWVERWDVVFAELYLDAHDADLAHGVVPRPWRLAFEAPPDLPDLRHVLLGINVHNTFELHTARLTGPDAYTTRLAELELLSAAKIADLLEPGQVLLRLAVAGFGVTLPPAVD